MFHLSNSHFLKKFSRIADFHFPIIFMSHYLQSKPQYDKKLPFDNSQSTLFAFILQTKKKSIFMNRRSNELKPTS